MNDSVEIPYDLLAQAVDLSSDGVAIVDAGREGQPLIYVNAGFEKLTGFSAAELLGKSYHSLQSTDTEQPGLGVLHEAFRLGKSCNVTLRNYRKDGSMFWNALSITAITDPSGTLTHFISIQRDITSQVLLEQYLHESHMDAYALSRQAHTLYHTDPVVGICNRLHFNEQFTSLLQTSQRTHNTLSVLMLDIDQFKRFNDRYGRTAGDACLRMIGEHLAKSFGRASDCVARYEGDKLAVISMGSSIEGMRQHAEKLRDQIRALNIPNHDSSYGVVTICIGGISLVPQRGMTAESLLQQADEALQKAKRRGYDCDEFL